MMILKWSFLEEEEMDLKMIDKNRFITRTE
jgi:hypothetical protein